MKRNEKGITLIVLAITIIVILIIAGTVISTTKGQKGVIKEAETMSSEAERQSVIQKIEADLYNEKIKTGKKPTKAEMKELIKRKDYAVSVDEDSFVSKNGNHTINYSEILGWGNRTQDKPQNALQVLE